MTNEETLKLALEALKSTHDVGCTKTDDAIKALEEALAKQEQPIKEVVINADYREMWKQQVEMNQQLTAALSAQPAKQEHGEPVAITITGKLGNIYSFTGDYSLKKGDKVYTTPQQRKPLTDEDCTRIYNEANGITTKNPPITTQRIFAAMRAAHGIKE